MNLLADILNYVRRIVKAPSNSTITDSLLIDYVNRFWLMDVDARVQLFDFKTKWGFQTTPGIDSYNMPMYNVQVESPGENPANIASFPVYQGFTGNCYVNGIQIPFHTTQEGFSNLWPNYIQALQPVAYGDGSTTTFSFSLPFFPAIPGHLDITGIIANTAGIGAIQDPIFTSGFPVNTDGTISLPNDKFLSWSQHCLSECQWWKHSDHR